MDLGHPLRLRDRVRAAGGARTQPRTSSARAQTGAVEAADGKEQPAARRVRAGLWGGVQ